MFDDWKQAWRQAVENFQREAADGAAPRVRAMAREIASASGALAKLDQEIRRAQRDLETEQEAERVCRRREQLAREAGDEETVAIAIDFAGRHAERAAVLERKIAVLSDERALLTRDVDTMKQMLEAAGPEAGDAARMEPAQEERDTGDREFSRMERTARERAADERLAELKRRMGG
jgi:hypothetical protein